MMHSLAEHEECLFCRILKGEIPCACVYDSDSFLAFLDINPVVIGHTLLVPKYHCETLLTMPDFLAPELLSSLRLIGEGLMQATGAEGFNCVQNNFAAAGQVVFHAHWHIIPRLTNDGLSFWPQGNYDSPDVMGQVAKVIGDRINCICRKEGL